VFCRVGMVGGWWDLLRGRLHLILRMETRCSVGYGGRLVGFVEG
jgi:hypothetical protein